MERGEGIGDGTEKLKEELTSEEEESDMDTEEGESGSDTEESDEGSEGDETEEDGDEEEGDEEGEEGEEWESTSETSESESEEEADDKNNNAAETQKLNNQISSSSSQPNLDDISDLSDGETERCPVCLSRFVGQKLGMPETCDHAFCLECILEWSKNVNTCPKDRQVYHLILVKNESDGPVIKQVKVEDKQLQVEAAAEEDNTCCEVCGRSDHEDRLLLCDGCDLGYHCECLEPPLRRVPVGEWFCPDCASFGVADVVQEETVTVAPRRRRAEPDLSAHLRRMIPRTLAAERVRSRIEEIRSVRGRRRIISDSDDAESDGSQAMEDDTTADPDAPSTSTTRRTTSPRKKTTRKKTVRRKTRKRKTKRKTTTKKRKTTTAKTTTSSTGTKSTTVKKRKTKTKSKTRKRRKVSRKKSKRKGKVRTLRATPKSLKTRLAETLGLKAPPVGTTIPTVRSNSTFWADRPRELGSTSLTILGDRDDLDPFMGSSDDEMPTSSGGGTGSTAVAQRARVSHFSRASMKSCSVIRPRVAPNRREASSQVEPQTSSSTGGFDLLGNIMMGQSLLHLTGDQVTIRRDGSLQHNRVPEIKTQTSIPSKSGGLPALKDAKIRRNAAGDNNSNNSPADSPRSGGSSDNTSGNNSLDGDQNTGNYGDGQQDASGSSGDNHRGSGGGGDGAGSGRDSAGRSYSDSGAGDTTLRTADKDEDSESDDDKGADSHNEDNTAEGTGRQTPPDTLNRDKNTNNKGSKEYDPASPSESQDELEIPSPKYDKSDGENEDGKDEVSPSKIKEDKEEEYDPFAPTSDPEDKSDEEPAAELENDKDDKASNASSASVKGEEEDEGEEEPTKNKDSDEEKDHPRRDDEANSDEEEAEKRDSGSDNDEEREEIEPRGDSPTGSDLVAEDLLNEEGDNDDVEDSDDDLKMVPISELPRIPKLKRKETTETDEEQPTRSVLERASRIEKQDTFPRWEKRERAYRERDRGDRDRGDRDRSERDRGDRDRGDRDRSERDGEKSRKHKKDSVAALVVEEEEPSESPRSRRRRRKRRDHDKEEKVERVATTEYDSGGEEVLIVSSTTSSSRHKHKKRSRSRSKERRRDREKRDRSRSHERSRRRHERTSRSPSQEREETREKPRKKKKDRGLDSPERKHRRRSRSHSPHHRERDRDRDHRDKDSRDSERSRERRSNAEAFKGSVKMFSQSLKEASDVENTGRRFKLKRNFYQGSENQDPSKKYRYEEAESSYERRTERPEVKSAVVKPVAVQELYDSDDDPDCEIIKVEFKGGKKSARKHSAAAAPPPPESDPIVISPPYNSSSKNSSSSGSSKNSSSSGSSKPDRTSEVPQQPSRQPAAPPVPHTKTPQKQDTKVTFKLPDKSKKTATLVNKNKLDIFGSDEEEEDYDPFDPTESSSPPRPKEPASPKSNGSPDKDENKLYIDEDKQPPEPVPEKEKEESSKKDKKSESPKEPSPEKETVVEKPKPPQTPPLPNAPPPAEPAPRPSLVRLAAPPPDMPPAETGVAAGPRLGVPQNMVLQHVGGLPMMQQPGMPPQPGGRPVLMNHMMVNGPPPPFMPQFPPSRMWPHNVIIRRGLPPGMQGAQNGGPPEHLRFDHPPPGMAGMRPGMPPPPPPGLPGMGDKVDLATPPPPLPHKALEEMEQISQLLNARVGKKDSGLFKVPMPPPPLSGRERGDGKSGTDLDMEVVDMDVASPLSDDENLVSFSPPPLDDDKSGRHRGSMDLKDDDVPTSAVELDKRQKVGGKKLAWKYMKKLNRQERVVEEVKLAIKPHYSRGKIDKEEYKEILRKAVPKICHSKSGDINSAKIRTLIAAYVDKARKMRKYEARKAEPGPSSGSSSSAKANGQKKRK